MPEIRNVFAATDFSPGADRAARRAASVARTIGGGLHLVHVLPPLDAFAQPCPGPIALDAEAMRARAANSLGDLAERISRQFGIATERHLFHGRAHRAILEAIAKLEPDVAVLGARGEHDGVQPSQTVGDTALQVAERSGIPTLLARREVQEPYHHVVGCAKGVGSDRSVVQWSARMSPADLFHVLSAYEVPYAARMSEWGASPATVDAYAKRIHDQQEERLRRLLGEIGLPAARARLHVERGEAAATILRNAAQWNADLLVVGRRPQVRSLTHSPFGSVARQVAFLAPTDVMIVPPVAM